MRYSHLIYIPKIKIIPIFGREGKGILVKWEANNDQYAKTRKYVWKF